MTKLENESHSAATFLEPVTSERKLEDFLLELFSYAEDKAGEEEFANDFEYELPRRASRFSETGLLTRNKGLVIRFPSGAAFQVTIVQSEQAEGAPQDDDEGDA